MQVMEGLALQVQFLESSLTVWAIRSWKQMKTSFGGKIFVDFLLYWRSGNDK